MRKAAFHWASLPTLTEMERWGADVERKKSKRVNGHIGYYPRCGSRYPESHLQKERVSINSGPRRRVTRIRNSGWETPPETSPWIKPIVSAGTRSPSCTDLAAPARDAAAAGDPPAAPGCPPLPPTAASGPAARGDSARPFLLPTEAGPGPDPATQAVARRGAGARAPPRCAEAPSFGPKLGLPRGGASALRGLRGARQSRPGTSPQTSRVSLPGGGGPACSFPSALPAAQRPRTPRHHYPPAGRPASLPAPPTRRCLRRRPAFLTPPSSRPRGGSPNRRPPAPPAASHAARRPPPRCVSGPPARAACSHTKRGSGGRALVPLGAGDERAGGRRARPAWGSASRAGIYHATAGYGFRVIPCREAGGRGAGSRCPVPPGGRGRGAARRSAGGCGSLTGSAAGGTAAAVGAGMRAGGGR